MKASYSLEEKYQMYLIKCLFTDIMDSYDAGIYTLEEFKRIEELSKNVKCDIIPYYK